MSKYKETIGSTIFDHDKCTKLIKSLIRIDTRRAALDRRAKDVSNMANDEFMRGMRSYSRIYKAIAKITALAEYYQVSALSSMAVLIGNRCLTFPVWAGHNGIPFTAGDRDLLISQKNESIKALFRALSEMPYVVCAHELINLCLGTSYQETKIKVEQCRLSDLMLAASIALWIEIELQPVKYTSNSALTADLTPRLEDFHKVPLMCDDLKVTTLKFWTYADFEQAQESFAPIPTEIYSILLLTNFEFNQ